MTAKRESTRIYWDDNINHFVRVFPSSWEFRPQERKGQFIYLEGGSGKVGDIRLGQSEDPFLYALEDDYEAGD